MKANRLITLALVALVAACAAPKPAPPPVAPPPVVRPVPVPPPPRVNDWRDLPQSAGDWSWAQREGASIASFGSPPNQPLLRITCAAGKQRIMLELRGIAAVGEPIVVTTTSARRTLIAETGSDSGYLGAIRTSLPTRDPLLDAIAFSRGRFMIETPGLPALLVPSWPELSRVIEDCR
jgi:hypothetical protein